jgi:hypothetical protein
MPEATSSSSFINIVSTFIDTNQLVVGIVLGWLFTRVMEMLKRPEISFEVSDDKEFFREGKKFKFLNLMIKNQKPNIIKEFLFGNLNLNNARVWLRFLEYETGAEISKINARWASTKEPVDYQTHQPIISEILLPSRDTVPSGEDGSVSVAIKEDGEKSFFAFNNESYLHEWKYSDFELDDKKYLLEIIILADGHEFKHKFLLLNSSKSVKNFKIL